MNLPTFSLFSQLPTEIRTAIWSHPLPRVLYMNLVSVKPTIRKSPVLLRVCQESRSIALRRYELLNRRYICFQDDTLYLTYSHESDLHSLFSPGQFGARLRFLAVDVEWFLQAAVEVMEKIDQCSRLSELKIIGRQGTLKDYELVPLIGYTENKRDGEENPLVDFLRDIWVLGHRGKEMEWPKIYLGNSL